MFVEVLSFQPPLLGGSGPTLSTYNRISFSHRFGGNEPTVEYFSGIPWGGSEPTFEYFSAIALVALSNLSGGNLSSCTIHISLVAHLSMARSSEFSMSSDFFVYFCGSIFRHRQATLTHADLFSKRETRKRQRLAARGNILRKQRLAAFFSAGFPTSARVATLVRKFSYQLINKRPSSSQIVFRFNISKKKKHYCFVYLTRKPNFITCNIRKKTYNFHFKKNYM